MQIHFLRHATLVVAIQGRHILIDPMLSPAGALAPVANASSQRRIPLVDLPIADVELHYMLEHIDAVLLTHTHRDHWDEQAIDLLPKYVPIICQPSDLTRLQQTRFETLHPVESTFTWHGISIHRCGGQHGTGEIGQQMGTVSGFVLEAADEAPLYIAGDTIWCPEVEQALQTFQPRNVIVNAGAAQFLVGDPITMTADDVIRTAQALPSAQVIAVHMETVNHCLLTRADLRARIAQAGLEQRISVPEDGDLLELWPA